MHTGRIAALTLSSAMAAGCSPSAPVGTSASSGEPMPPMPEPMPPVDMAGQVVPRSPDSPHPGYEVVPGWLKLPDGVIVGESVGVEVDSHNHVFFFHRADRGWGNTTPIEQDTIFEVDGDTGDILSTWGKGLFLVPHGLTVDQDDNVWVTDVGLSQVFQFSHDGQLLQTIGAGNGCGCPGAPDAFDMPTDVTMTAGGDLYVSDGYGNSRVAEFTAGGAFVRQWGTAGIQPGELQIPHGVAFDGRVYVADRANARIQIFDATGALLEVWSGPTIGRPWGVAIGPTHHVFMIDGGDQIDDHPSGRAVELDTKGNTVTTWGSFGHDEGQFDAGHAIGVGPDGSVYVVEQVGKRIQKFRPVAAP